jgi:ferredoxin-thioredoxin reductase catalytic subunit
MMHKIQAQLQVAMQQQQQQAAVMMLVQVRHSNKQQMQSKQCPCRKISQLQLQQ